MDKYSRNGKILITVLGGWFGLHHYLNKNYKMGVLYTFTFGCFYIGWIIYFTAHHGKSPSPLRVVPAFQKPFTWSAGFQKILIWFWTGVYWDMAKMNHGRNVPIQNRMLLTKKPMRVRKYFCPKHSARQSKPAYPRKSVVKQMST